MSMLGGTWGAVLLPINSHDQTVDWGRLREELAILVDAGLEGLYTCGTAGEFHALDEDEFDRLSTLVAEHCHSSAVPFQIGASHMSGQTCLSRIARAKQLGPAAIQVVLPDWLPLHQKEVERAVEGMVEAARPLPVVLYNPPHAKTVCDPAQLASLTYDIGLAGVKVAANEDFYHELHSRCPQLKIFVPGHELSRTRCPGVVGSYSNVACLSPTGAARWGRLLGDNPEVAREIGERVYNFFAAHIGPLKAAGFGNTALDKALAYMGGWAAVGTTVRWPWSSVPESQAGQLGKVARRELPELF
jgi:dihydrodipicolinate synthase/N-acetylneuraminate lyase